MYIHLQFIFILHILTFNYQVDTDCCCLREKSQFRNFRSKVSLWTYLDGLVLIFNQYKKAQFMMGGTIPGQVALGCMLTKHEPVNDQAIKHYIVMISALSSCLFSPQ